MAHTVMHCTTAPARDFPALQLGVHLKAHRRELVKTTGSEGDTEYVDGVWYGLRGACPSLPTRGMGERREIPC